MTCPLLLSTGQDERKALGCWQGRLLPLARVVNSGPDGEELRLRVMLIALRGI